MVVLVPCHASLRADYRHWVARVQCPLQLRLEQFIILVQEHEHSVRSSVYRELTGRVITAVVMMRAVHQSGNGPMLYSELGVYRERACLIIAKNRRCRITWCSRGCS